MALSNGNNRQDGSVKFLTYRTTDKNKVEIEPCFETSEKVDGVWTVTGTFTRFSGNLEKVTPLTKEFKKDGKVIDTKEIVEFRVRDGDELYIISFTYRVATRMLFNATLNLESFEDIEISASRNKEWDNLWLKQGGKNVRGRYVKEDLPAVEEVTVGKKLIRSYDPVNTFFRDELEKLGEKIGKTPKREVASKVEPTVSESNDDQEIPF